MDRIYLRIMMAMLLNLC